MEIGSMIRAIRKRKNITIAQICEQTGLSQGFMSQLENNKTSPSLATLESIAAVLNVSLAYLLLSREERINVVKKDERPLTSIGKQPMTVYELGITRNMRVTLVELPPGKSSSEQMVAHEGEEIHTVVQGRVRVEYGSELTELDAGDSFSWNAVVPHRVTNIGAEPAKILISVYREREWI
ncbi:cupin domain-containing protein [Paenibacillus campi]|uniref:cupin domain-containing protein n=1 Tax=Paenibacillus campi TaxID=3106031 RepID=UPI002AFEAE6E|nr:MULTISPECIES: cupin domain-containing protein [unclassified Paenibacillus]